MKYTQHLLDSFYESTNSGVIQGADLVYKAEDPQTNDAVKFYFLFNEDVIKDVKYQACGSIVLFASLSAISNLIKNKTISEALEVSEKLVVKEIKQVNRCDYGVVCFSVKSLHQALQLAIKRLEKIKEKQGLKKIKIKDFITSKNISVCGANEESEPTILQEEQTVVAIKPVIEQNNKVKEEPVVEKKAPEDNEIEILSSVEEESLEFLDELTIEESEGLEKKDILESIPTKIEVRVLDEENEDQQTQTTEEDLREETINKEIKEEKPEEKVTSPVMHEDDMIDEIDSITAKLTDAITKLNFKFDVDEDN